MNFQPFQRLFKTKHSFQAFLLGLGVQFTIETSIKVHIFVNIRGQPSSQPQLFLRYRIWTFSGTTGLKRANFGLTDQYPEKEANHLLKPMGPIIHCKSLYTEVHTGTLASSYSKIKGLKRLSSGTWKYKPHYRVVP